MKKLLSLLLCAAMLFCLLPLEARAAAGAWDGTVDISWYDPEKTEYEIDTPAKLAGLAALVNGMVDPTARPSSAIRLISSAKRAITFCLSARAAAMCPIPSTPAAWILPIRPFI